MLFQSFEYLVFLPIVLFIYWVVLKNKVQAQNLLLLTASYVFYGWWDWRFLSLIAISSILDFFIGRGIYFQIKSNKKTNAKYFLWMSIIVNIGLLAFFKYFNFFIDSFTLALSQIGIQSNTYSLSIILPVGISFYTFQTLSYSIDIYKGKLKPTSDVVAFFAFVSFFPQLVAGPIERARNLLPQFEKKRKFKYEQAKDGLLQIVVGLFKKLVIADTCARYADMIFESKEHLSGSVLFIGAVYFAFQIYGDFSGYSDIAIGSAKLFGFKLMTNFKTPYFSRDIAEFWRRWHISLSTWFRDYVYIPLGGSRVNKLKAIRNTFIVFTLSGFWHGANWTFIIWGGLNALYFLPFQLLKLNRVHIGEVASNRILPSFKEGVQILLTFFFTTIAWVFFRAKTVPAAFSYLSKMFSWSLFSVPNQYRTYLPLIVCFVIIEWINRDKEHMLQFRPATKRIVRWFVYYVIVLVVMYNISGEKVKFIYFDF